MNAPSSVAIIGDICAEDDHVHAVQPVENFLESNLFYYAGKTASGKTVGGIIRVANKPNQGHADATVLYFPGDGSALFNFEHPEIADNASWRVSGWDLEVVSPGGIEFRSAYRGTALHLADPHLLATPKLAYQQPRVALTMDLTHFGKSPMVEFRYNNDNLKGPGSEDIAGTRGLHQLTSFSGSIAVGGTEAEAVEGYGWRDHNWGPRNWQAFPRHAFYTANFGDDCGFVLFKTEGGLGYFMHDGPDRVHEVTAIDMVTEYEDDGREPCSLRAEVTLDNGATHTVEGQQVGYIPLRNRRGGMTTHLGYSLWHYQLDGERDGCGIAEHLSQSDPEGES